MLNIRNIDLNLLVIFNALLEDQSTVKVAKRLALSQPAVSHALNRLRETFDDPLFVRASRGLVATPRALSLAPELNDFILRAEKLLGNAPIFIPKEARVTFRIATTDYFEQIAFPKILKILEKEAPYCQIISRPTKGLLPKEDLETGDIDVAIAGFFGELPDGYHQRELYKDDFVCVARKGHPYLKDKVTLKNYAEQMHVLISMHGDMKSNSSAILKKHKLEQKYLAGSSSFLSPGWIVSETDLLLTCPRKLAESYKIHLPVELFELPFKLNEIKVTQVWHGRNQNEAHHKWLRQMIANVCEKI
jgi:DNA-binding transcriptional LysR family regulator